MQPQHALLMFSVVLGGAAVIGGAALVAADTRRTRDWRWQAFVKEKRALRGRDPYALRS